MKKFICLHCGANEYSSHDNGKPCQRCMGKMVEVPMKEGTPSDWTKNKACRDAVLKTFGGES